MSPFPKPTAFFGPQHAFYKQADWPAPCQYHLQLHDMLPGDHYNATDWAILMQPHILVPTGQWNHWRKLGPPFFFQYKQRSTDRTKLSTGRGADIRIQITKYVPVANCFFIQLWLGIHQFARNTVLSPSGVFAYGGYCTLSREAT